MADTGLFDSAWRKWDWAGEHAIALEADIAGTGTEPHSEAVFDASATYDSRRHAFVVTVTAFPPIPPDWGLRLGDVAHNYRAALDHLAWALVQRAKHPKPLTERQKKGVYFPIARTPADLRGLIPKYLPDVGRADDAIVRRYQPYNRGKRKAPWQALSILHALNNLDKHRSIQPTHVFVDRGLFQITNQHDCEITQNRIRGRRQPLKVGAEFGTIPARKTGPDPHLEVNIGIATKVGIEPGTPLVEWFDQTEAWIYSLLHDFADAPADIQPHWLARRKRRAELFGEKAGARSSASSAG